MLLSVIAFSQGNASFAHILTDKERPSTALVAVKAPVFSTHKLRGVDPTLGPSMQSTGEVIGSYDASELWTKVALGRQEIRMPVFRES